MRFIAILFLITFLGSCDPPQEMIDPYRPTKGALVDEVINTAFKQLKAEKELYPFGTGYQMMYQIKMLALAFHYYKEVEIDEARELLVCAARTFLDIINKNEQIRKHLDNYPFKPENIQIEIFLENSDGSKFTLEKLCVITMKNGVLKYKVDHPDMHRFLIIQEETYDEAVAKLNSSNQVVAMLGASRRSKT